jgi:hypothetical protein
MEMEQQVMEARMVFLSRMEEMEALLHLKVVLEDLAEEELVNGITWVQLELVVVIPVVVELIIEEYLEAVDPTTLALIK